MTKCSNGSVVSYRRKYQWHCCYNISISNSMYHRVAWHQYYGSINKISDKRRNLSASASLWRINGGMWLAQATRQNA